MDRAQLQAFVWSRARGVEGLLALQTATHGGWLPELPLILRLRATCKTFEWMFTKRLRERQEPAEESD